MPIGCSFGGVLAVLEGSLREGGLIVLANCEVGSHWNYIILLYPPSHSGWPKVRRPVDYSLSIYRSKLLSSVVGGCCVIG